MSDKNTPWAVSFSDILRAHWRGARGQYGSFWLIIVAFVANAVAGIVAPIYLKYLFDGLSANATQAELVSILYVFIAISFAGWAASRIGFWFLNSFESSAMARLLQDSLEYMLGHSYSFYQNNFTGSLVQRVRRFSSAFERLTDTLVMTLIPIAVTIVGSVIVVYQEHPMLAFIILGWVAVFIALNYAFSMYKLPYDVRRAELDSETTGVLSDTLTNHTAVTLFTAHQAEEKTFADVTERRARAMWVSWTLGSVFDGLQSLIMLIVTFAVFYVAIGYWAAGAISIGTFALIQIYVIRLSERMWDLGRVIRNVYEALADSREMVEIMHLSHDITDTPGATPLAISDARVSYDDVSFNYNETRRVLSNVSLTIEPGQKVAFVGPSGAGKTTIVRLLLRLYDVTSGAIRIDGQDIRSVTLESLRSAVSLVPQDPVLFHRSLMENIRFGRPGATDEEVVAAAKLAHCHEFISSLPDSYQTFVGERGVKLSGGERQRVAIARAILKNAPILILDEATSSLDSQSESLIQDALDVLMRGKTVLVIAHRLSTVRKMDRIVVIDEGGVREDGSHDDLLKNSDSLYKSLWELQAGGFIKDKDE
jgi:ATP-binding cassette, subfamily B, bacterial